LQTDTVRVQNIPQGYDAFQLVHISAAYYRQGVQLGRTHTFQRKMK
jgi:hypothetical protein